MWAIQAVPSDLCFLFAVWKDVGSQLLWPDSPSSAIREKVLLIEEIERKKQKGIWGSEFVWPSHLHQGEKLWWSFCKPKDSLNIRQDEPDRSNCPQLHQEISHLAEIKNNGLLRSIPDLGRNGSYYRIGILFNKLRTFLFLHGFFSLPPKPGKILHGSLDFNTSAPTHVSLILTKLIYIQFVYTDLK